MKTFLKINIAAIGLAASLLGTSDAMSADRSLIPSEVTDADVQCLVAIMETGDRIDRVAPGTSQIVAMYFMGRLDGRNPDLDLEAAIREMAPKMSAKDLGEADIRCGKQLSERGREMSLIGKHLMDHPEDTISK